MKTNLSIINKKLFLSLLFVVPMLINATNNQQDVSDFISFSGIVFGYQNEKLASAILSIEKTNISTVSNKNGEFLIKVPVQYQKNTLSISYLGYATKKIHLKSLETGENKIYLKILPYALPDLEVISKNPELIIQNMFNNRTKNYSGTDQIMRGFYRETIKKGQRFVSLSEAVTDVYKSSYSSSKSDMAALVKLRKSTDYTRLDTLVFKLMGGPFNNVFLDAMRYPSIIFTDEPFYSFDFKFVKTEQIDDKYVYLIDFKQRPYISTPLYFGRLYIDVERYALIKAEFELNLENNAQATQLFIRKKPLSARVSTTNTHYTIQYREMNDKWYYSYSKIDLGFKINWKRKLFTTNYTSSIEMAITDWEDAKDRKAFQTKDRIYEMVVIQDRTEGFSDPDFWGHYNVIEPEKPIENAINKIKKQLEKNK
jgi:hypothetical protein